MCACLLQVYICIRILCHYLLIFIVLSLQLTYYDYFDVYHYVRLQSIKKTLTEILKHTSHDSTGKYLIFTHILCLCHHFLATFADSSDICFVLPGNEESMVGIWSSSATDRSSPNEDPCSPVQTVLQGDFST